MPATPTHPALLRLLGGEPAHPLAPDVLERARRHQVLPLLAHGSTQPDLQPHARHNALRALAAAAVLTKVQSLLTQQGIDMLALKGVALSQSLYGDMSRRHVGDVDVLIDPAHLERADRALRAAGLQRRLPAEDLSPTQWRLYTRVRHEFVYRDAQYDFGIDLHWRLNTCAALSPGTFDELWQRRTQVEVGGSEVAMLGRDDLLLHLCIHGGVEAWPKLKWLVDVADLLPQFDERSARQLEQRAQHLGLERLLRLGTALAAGLLDAPLRFEAPSASLLKHARTHLMELRFKAGGGAALGGTLADLAYRLRLSRNWRYPLQSLVADAIVPATVLRPDYRSWPLAALMPWAALRTQGGRLVKRLSSRIPLP